MADDHDVLVLGGGVAGVAAAIAAAQHGARVLLVRAGPGASALCLGGWRGIPPAPFGAALAQAGLALEHRPCRLPRPDGTLLEFDAAPPSHVRAELNDDAERTLVCGIVGLPGFHARALVALWADAARLRADRFTAAELSLDDTPPAGWSPVALAALLEREPQRIARPLAALARTHSAARAILPAVLGLEAHATVHRHIDAEANVVVGEALGAAPALPGWRLDAVLRTALARAGVTVLTARVTGRQARAHRVDSISLEGDGGARTIHATSVVLATGKFIGGGVTAAPRFIETALGCDIALDRFDSRFDDAAASLLLTAEVRDAPQPLLEIGVRTDAESRPLSETGDIAYRNVVVAGSVRAGTSTAVLGLGHAATDGWNAGARAAALARVAA